MPKNGTPNDVAVSRERAKRELSSLIDECIDRWTEAGSDLTQVDFFGLSLQVSTLAATLGFRVPPIELMVHREPDRHPLLKVNPRYSFILALKINDPSGLSYVETDLQAYTQADRSSAARSKPDTWPPPNLTTLKKVEKTLRSWKRRVGAVEPAHVQLADNRLVENEPSLQRLFFVWALQKELGAAEPMSPKQMALQHLAQETLTSPEVVQEFKRQANEHAKQYQLAATIEAATPARPAKRPPQGSDTDWRDVERRLLELYDRGEPYATYEELRKRLACSKGTISKAMKNSPKLRGWMKRAKGGAAVRATSLTGEVADEAIQRIERAPEVEAGRLLDSRMARLIDEARDEDTKAKLRNMPPEGQDKINGMLPAEFDEFVELVSNDPDAGDKVLGRKA